MQLCAGHTQHPGGKETSSEQHLDGFRCTCPAQQATSGAAFPQGAVPGQPALSPQQLGDLPKAEGTEPMAA